LCTGKNCTDGNSCNQPKTNGIFLLVHVSWYPLLCNRSRVQGSPFRVTLAGSST
jgi:hypothetical protein